MNRVIVLGSSGALGSALIEEMQKTGIECKGISRADCDLTNINQVSGIISWAKPNIVVNCAAYVRGSHFRIQNPWPTFSKNIELTNSIINALVKSEHKRNFFINSQLAKSNETLSNESPKFQSEDPYVLAKQYQSKAIQLANRQYELGCKEIFLPNLYGPSDHFDLSKGHVVASALLKTWSATVNQEAEIRIEADFTVKRRFAFIPDVAKWLADKVSDFDSLPYQIPFSLGLELSVGEVYEIAALTTGYKGRISFTNEGQILFFSDSASRIRTQAMHQQILSKFQKTFEILRATESDER